MSLKCSVGVFENVWYKQRHGIPTGGSLCVQLANIAVFYVLNKEVYTDSELMKNVKSTKRYIDDGAGFTTDSDEQFLNWIKLVNEKLAKWGLIIDEWNIKHASIFASFLDIHYCMDESGNLQTDLYVKDTDSRAYLHFSSSHANHIFSGIVYSQCIRLRRIINCSVWLQSRLNDLKSCFLNCGYPRTLIDNIMSKVLSLERDLTRRKRNEVSESLYSPIRIVTTFGADDEIINSIKKFEGQLLKTKSFNAENYKSPSSNSTDPKSNLFQWVKKTGPSLRNRLVKTKNLALGMKHGVTKPCKQRNCQACGMICSKESLQICGKKVKPSPGNCSSYNIIYLFVCKICGKPYVGRTTNELKCRGGEHRRAFYDILNSKCYDPLNDDLSLGIHLAEHGLKERRDFNTNYEICILENCNPGELEVKEHKYIHLLQSLPPNGINVSNPFRIPLLS